MSGKRIWFGYSTLVAMCLVALGSCLSSDTTVCTSGLVCPAGTQCNLDGTTCLSIESCGNARINEGEDCDDGNSNSDTLPNACRSTCRSPQCGDGVTDTLGTDGVADTADDEVCDDGNSFNADPITGAADGCSADCKSTQVCGNGFVDPLTSEVCDDGNAMELDGCSTSCQLVAGVWEATNENPPERSNHGMIYDVARSHLLIVGGSGGAAGEYRDTWQLVGNAWTDLSPPNLADGLAPGEARAIAYDVSRARAVLIVSNANAGRIDTLEWDGAAWSNVSPRLPGNSPSSRQGSALVYDPGRKRVVLFGGFSTGALNDTWEWDGTRWTDVSPAGDAPTPPARRAHQMAYDPVRGRIVLFGGFSASTLADTWEWDGTRWTDLTPGAAGDSPSRRHGHAMTFDATRGRVLLFGGDQSPVEPSLSDTWEWDGTRWTDLSPGAAGDSPPRRHLHGMAYDTIRKRVVLFGGVDASPLADTWEWDGSSWVAINPTAVPAPRNVHAMAYDAGRGRAVLFGGFDGATSQGDTWEWDGYGWADFTPAIPSDSPPARLSHAMAYDTARQQVVLFGGFTNSLQGDTWVWDGTHWTDLTPAAPGESPPARLAHALAYDSARERVVLFGGEGVVGNLRDTWEWDGSRWADLTPSAEADSPTARLDLALAYDVSRQRVLLFGGEDGGDRNDTWEWDGNTWGNVTPVESFESPSPRSAHRMSYDAAAARIVLFGGLGSMPIVGNTWEWQESRWQVSADSEDGPPIRGNHAQVYDAARGRTLVVGGSKGENFNDTWMYSHRAVGPKQCLSGLDGDDDGLVGCEDPDCWGYCLPMCPPESTPLWPDDCDFEAPHCGDGICNNALENNRLCPSDCQPGAALCGDHWCDAGETLALCPGDCTP